MKWILFGILILWAAVSYCFSATLSTAEDSDDPRHPLPPPQRYNAHVDRGQAGNNGVAGRLSQHLGNGANSGRGRGVGNPHRPLPVPLRPIARPVPQRPRPVPQRPRPVPARPVPPRPNGHNRQTQTPRVTTSTTFAPPESLDTVKPWEEWLDVWESGQEGCGIPSTEPFLKELRVAGGTTASSGNWPWMVSLSNKMLRQHWCGGVLISDQWVLTAAHCLFSVPPPLWGEATWTVRLGKQIIGEMEETEQDFNVSKLMVHPGFDSRMVLSREEASPPSDNDIALVKLERRAQLTPWVRPVCLPEQGSKPRERERCVVTGWGFTSSDPPPSQTLQQGVVPIMAHRYCKNLEGYEELLTPHMICAGYKDGGVDACKFDSGGPLQCQYGDKWYTVGVTSWGDSNGGGCARPLRPGVYAGVGNYVNWIQETIYADYAELPQISWERIIPNPMKPAE